MLLAAVLLEFETSARYYINDALNNVYCGSMFLKEIGRFCDLFVASTRLSEGRELPYKLCLCWYACVSVYVFPNSIIEPVDKISPNQIKHYAVEGHPNRIIYNFLQLGVTALWTQELAKLGRQ